MNIDRNTIPEIIKKGLSTSELRVPNLYLKTDINRPISTSGVYDCSVLYLANEKTKTHSLYHMYIDADKKIQRIIRTLMPEGYTKAAIIPGSNTWSHIHQQYLPEVFKAVKENGNNPSVYVYHYSSEVPEIVGYEGNVYEIMRRNYKDKGQATFRVENHFFE